MSGVKASRPIRRGLRWLALVLLVGALGAAFLRAPWEQRRIDRLADDIAQRYDIVLRFGDPSDFHLPPYPPAPDLIHAEPADPYDVYSALRGIDLALSVYPTGLIKQHLAAIFIAGDLEIGEVRAAGTYLYAWIYISAAGDLADRGPAYIAETVHHELSSLLFLSGRFPTARWLAANPADFDYLPTPEAVLEAAGTHQDPVLAETWYRSGFVSDYGLSSLENDVNTFAEMAFGRPDDLRALAGRYPGIAEKLSVLIDFYTGLAPEMGRYFETAGLKGGSSTAP